MGLIAKETVNSDFKPVPAGLHLARCCRLIDLGTQRIVDQYGERDRHKINVAWEVFGDDENGQPLIVKMTEGDFPMIISKTYTMSLSANAILRRDLIAWRGRDFNADELKGFNLRDIIGKFCMLNVTRAEYDGKTFSRVEGITPVPAMLKSNLPAPVHQNLVFDFDNFDQDVFNKIPEKQREYIAASYEYQKLFPPLMPAPSATSSAASAESAPSLLTRFLNKANSLSTLEELEAMREHIQRLPEADRKAAERGLQARIVDFQQAAEELEDIPF